MPSKSFHTFSISRSWDSNLNLNFTYSHFFPTSLRLVQQRKRFIWRQCGSSGSWNGEKGTWWGHAMWFQFTSSKVKILNTDILWAFKFWSPLIKQSCYVNSSCLFSHITKSLYKWQFVFQRELEPEQQVLTQGFYSIVFQSILTHLNFSGQKFPHNSFK